MNVRKAAVAGQFYEADASALQAHVDELLDGPAVGFRGALRALIVPHAGYIYSGAVAATAYRHLQYDHDSIQRIALFGPAHRVSLQGMALPSADAFATPLGEIPLDRPVIEQMATMADVCISDEAHREEHSLEVQLPFLQTVLGRFSLVPVVVGRSDPRAVAVVMDALFAYPDTLLVVSSDLSHFLPYEQAKRVDAQTCDRIIAKESPLTGAEACGAHALNGLLSTAFCRPLEVELLDLRNSGDTAGSPERVVGYGAFIVH